MSRVGNEIKENTQNTKFVLTDKKELYQIKKLIRNSLS